MAGQQQRQWVDLNSIVSAYIDENELSEHKRFKLWNLAFRGMEQLGLDFFYSVISIPLTINANHTANIPSNSLGVLKVGAFNGSGELIAYQKNTNISSYSSMLPSRLQKYEGYDASNTTFNNYTDNGYFGNLNCRLGSRGNGTFNIDEKNGIILLNNFESYGYLAIEYLSSPEMGGTYRIPVQFKQALISFIDWKNMPANAKGGGAWRAMKNDFFNERRLAGGRYDPFVVEEAYISSLATTSIPL